MEPVVRVTTHLGRPLTYLRLVFLLLGAALAVALSILDATLIVVADQYLSGVPLVAVAVVIVAVPIGVTVLVPPIRQVEGVAAESLLGVDFPDGTPGPARRLEERLRATAWFLLHVVSGGAAVMGLVFLLPLGMSFVTASDAWRVPVGVALLAAALAAPLLLGAAVARVAPPLLGPSYSQRLEQLETQTARLVERNRIARELHDSVGHALSVVTLQSAGARRRLHAGDPEAAEAALEAIESTARAATAELDHMLGLLRDRAEGAAHRTAARPRRPGLPGHGHPTCRTRGPHGRGRRPRRPPPGREPRGLPDRPGGPDQRASARLGAAGPARARTTSGATGDHARQPGTCVSDRGAAAAEASPASPNAPAHSAAASPTQR